MKLADYHPEWINLATELLRHGREDRAGMSTGEPFMSLPEPMEAVRARLAARGLWPQWRIWLGGRALRKMEVVETQRLVGHIKAPDEATACKGWWLEARRKGKTPPPLEHLWAELEPNSSLSRKERRKLERELRKLSSRSGF